MEQFWLIEILLPLAYNDGTPIGDDVLECIRQELIDEFGGLTAFVRSPAEGVWKKGAEAARDEIVILEVMTTELDQGWWKAWRSHYEGLLQQHEIVVRAANLQRL